MGVGWAAALRWHLNMEACRAFGGNPLRYKGETVEMPGDCPPPPIPVQSVLPAARLLGPLPVLSFKCRPAQAACIMPFTPLPLNVP